MTERKRGGKRVKRMKEQRCNELEEGKEEPLHGWREGRGGIGGADGEMEQMQLLLELQCKRICPEERVLPDRGIALRKADCLFLECVPFKESNIGDI